jgi:hypothetical protein
MVLDGGEIHLRLPPGTAGKAAPLRLRCRIAAAISALDGTQPVFRQSPPISAASISTTARPSAPPPPPRQALPIRADDADRSVSIMVIANSPCGRRFRIIGSADSAASPSIGNSTCGAEKITPRSGRPPLAKTWPSPDPTEVNTSAPG